ncbi:hypothetical protein CRYUN_Cryun25bG0049900 [Craigia yunnanensis]
MRDGLISNATQANAALPSSFEALDAIIQKFVNVSLNITNVASLSGNLLLFNFSRTGALESTMETSMLSDIQSFCPADANKNTVLNRNSTNLFENHYFKNLLNRKGLLGSDQILYSSDLDTSTTKSLVESYSSNW